LAIKYTRRRFTARALRRTNGGSKKIWRLLNESCGRATARPPPPRRLNTVSGAVDTPLGVAEAFADFFSEIGYQTAASIPRSSLDPDLIFNSLPVGPNTFHLSYVDPSTIVKQVVHMDASYKDSICSVPDK